MTGRQEAATCAVLTDGERAGAAAEPRYGTRWGRCALVLAPAVAAVAALGAAMATGALALSFVAQAGTLELVTSGLRGDDLGIVVVSLPTRDGDGADGESAHARIGVGAGKINGLCIAQRGGVLGRPFTLLISGGDADPSTFEIAADGLILDLTDVEGVIAGGGELEVNKNGADVRVAAPGIDLAGPADRFGLQASSVQLRDIVATVRAISIPELLDVPGFRIEVLAGARRCPPPAVDAPRP